MVNFFSDGDIYLLLKRKGQGKGHTVLLCIGGIRQHV
jgi:hypothetical protein